MNAPDNLAYAESHEWVLLDAGLATVGITDFAQGELGDIVFVELPEVGAAVRSGKEFGTVESVKAVSELFSPVTGEVTEVNETLRDAPEKINSDPYGEGWILKVKLSDPREIEGLMNAAAYARFVKEGGAEQ